MKVALRDNQDFWAGIFLIVVGAVAIYIAREYPFGTSLRMGPGYFPTVLGGVLVAFGAGLLIKSIRSMEKIEAGWSLRALIVLPLSLVMFGFLMEHAGFVPALVVLIVGSSLASNEFNLIEVAILTAVLVLGCVAVFIWGIGLPYELFGGV
jgi:hypothetical protein